MKEEYLIRKYFVDEIEALQKELDEGNIDVYKFYEEIIAIKEYIKHNQE